VHSLYIYYLFYKNIRKKLNMFASLALNWSLRRKFRLSDPDFSFAQIFECRRIPSTIVKTFVWSVQLLRLRQLITLSNLLTAKLFPTGRHSRQLPQQQILLLNLYCGQEASLMTDNVLLKVCSSLLSVSTTLTKYLSLLLGSTRARLSATCRPRSRDKQLIPKVCPASKQYNKHLAEFTDKASNMDANNNIRGWLITKLLLTGWPVTAVSPLQLSRQLIMVPNFLCIVRKIECSAANSDRFRPGSLFSPRFKKSFSDRSK